ncbi:MAG: LysM peptidoglycan-binding domain-containing protein [Candidatus Levyibacteriota bacterium]|jgi:nucleoid-associated protein YgaU
MPKAKKIKTAKKEGFLTQIKWGESYTSLFLGAVVVVVALVLVFSFIKSRNNLNRQQTQSSSTVAKEEVKVMPKTYTVQSGDYLWSIAEKIYGSGYNWVDLANANHLQNPGVIYAGTKLVVPDVAPKMLTVQAKPVQVQNPITGDTYTVVKGDYLWDIAVRAYGDGYQWVEIAKTNNLTNPDLIFSGNVLQLPR